MSLTAKNIITLLSLKGVGRTSVLGFAKFAEHTDICIQSMDDYLSLISECHETEKCRVDAKCFTNLDLQEAELKAEKIISKSQALGINIVSYSDEQFPVKLRNIVSRKTLSKGEVSIKDESPVILFFKGENISRLNDVKSVAIVGTREPTPEGKTAGVYLSKAIAKRGFNIVGGLAIGCDTFGHEGAIEADGMTTAFLAHGLHTIYPKENEALAQKIVESGGLLISEYPIGTEPLTPYFVERDRLQSGISDATIVVQTGIVGGTMHAVNATLMNNKPLFAIEYASDLVMRHERDLGNRKLSSEGKAHSITSHNIQECIELIMGGNDSNLAACLESALEVETKTEAIKDLHDDNEKEVSDEMRTTQMTLW